MSMLDMLRGRPNPASDIATMLPLPSDEAALSVPVAELGSFIESLVLPSEYKITHPGTRRALKLALYAFALSSHSPYARHFYGDEAGSGVIGVERVDDAFNLTAAQSKQFPKSKQVVNSRACGHVFKSGESVYRCRDCAVDPTCVLCSRCYQSSVHASERHDVTMSVHGGLGTGCCDCGDPEAFKDGKCWCKYHHPADGADQAPNDEPQHRREIKQYIEVLVARVVEWVIAILERSPELLIAPKHRSDFVVVRSTQPTAAPAAVASGDSSTSSRFAPNLEAQPTPSPSNIDVSLRTPTASDMQSPLNPATTAEHGPWSVILWNDEKHSFDEVIEQVSRATGATRREAGDVASRVDAHGRDIIFTSTNTSGIITVSRYISAISLTVSVRTAVDAFYEEIAGDLVDFLQDLCMCRVDGEQGALAETVARVLLRVRSPVEESPFQRLLRLDGRTWKHLRKTLSEMYVSMIGASLQVKTDMGSFQLFSLLLDVESDTRGTKTAIQFSQSYRYVAECYLLWDREPEYSIIYLGVQLCTVPSISAILVEEHSMLLGLVAIMYSFFTEQVNPLNPRKLILPPSSGPSRQIDPESSAFKQKRYFQLFSEVQHLLGSSQTQKIVCEQPKQVEAVILFLDLFSGMNPNRRAVSSHVEYESDTWVSAFNVTIQLGRLCRAIGEAYRHGTVQQIAGATRLIAERVMLRPVPTKQVAFSNQTFEVLDIRVESRPMSFHHPLAWMFAEMMKSLPAFQSASTSLRSFIEANLHPLCFEIIIEEALSVSCLLSQIKAGLWVRNGFAMRAQQLHYKDYSLRENTYDQDIYLLQLAFVVIDPGHFVSAIVDRFHLLEWLQGATAHETYEASQCVVMAEEMLLLLIALFSEPVTICQLTSEQAIRREVVHYLALGSSTFSDLVRRVSEQYSDDPALDKILKEVAIYRQPVGTSDQGTFTLKKQYFREVSPYFSRYTRNQREEAEKAVKAALAPNDSAYVTLPQRLDLTETLFADLQPAMVCEQMMGVITASIVRSVSANQVVSEQLLDEALQLVMIGLVQDANAVASRAIVPSSLSSAGGKSLAQLLVALEQDERLRYVRPKITWCLKSFEQSQPEHIGALRGVAAPAEPAAVPQVDEKEAKRRAAKARQEAIMKQFAQAQQSFLEGNEDVEADEDEAMNDGEVSLGSCIVCQDALDSSQAFGSLGFLQHSNFMRTKPAQSIPDAELKMPTSLDADMSSLRPFALVPSLHPELVSHKDVNADEDDAPALLEPPAITARPGLHASGCGHMMHASCFETYIQSIELRHHAQPTRCHPEDIERREFVCPLCKSLGNVLFPTTTASGTFPSLNVEFDSRPLHSFGGALEQGTAKSDAVRRRLRLDAPLRELRESLLEADETLSAVDIIVISQALAKEADANGPSKSSLSQVILYTLGCLEIASRGTDDQAGEIPDTSKQILGSLLHVCRHVTSSLERPSFKAHLSSLLRAVRSTDTDSFDPCMQTLVEWSVIEPETTKQFAAFAFYAHLFDVLAQSWIQCAGLPSGTAVEAGEAEAEIEAFDRLGRFCPADLACPPKALGKLIYNHGIGFLRRVAGLVAVLGHSVDTGDMDGNEMARLLKALSIPNPVDVLSDDPTSDDDVGTMRVWVEDVEVEFDAIRGRASLLENYVLDFEQGKKREDVSLPPVDLPGIYELVGLPERLDTLIAEGMRRVCPKCKQVPSEPAICLVCCQTLCNQTFCCMDEEVEGRFGECNLHMWSCGGSIGMFYVIKKNSILYLYTDRGCFASPPYLDSHGEVDVGHRRIRHQFPQFLHANRYDQVRKAYMYHTIPTIVARKLESTTDWGGWTTM